VLLKNSDMSDCEDAIKSRVLNWLDSLKVPKNCYGYRFSANADNTVFCTCFALFILDLYRKVYTSGKTMLDFIFSKFPK